MRYNLLSLITLETVLTGETNSRQSAFNEMANFINACIPPFFHVIVSQVTDGFLVYQLAYTKKTIVSTPIYLAVLPDSPVWPNADQILTHLDQYPQLLSKTHTRAPSNRRNRA